MIRYYGALANRVRGKLLPIIYSLLNQQQICKNDVQKVTFVSMMKATFNIDPLSCILCGKKMLLEFALYGKSSVLTLLPFHRKLALLQKI
jgi:hypothetical protein